MRTKSRRLMPAPAVLLRLVEIWNLPAAERLPHQQRRGFYPDRRRKIPDLLAQLTAEFSAEEVVRSAAGFLDDLIIPERDGVVLSLEDKAVVHCTLRLVGDKDGVSISRELAKDIVGAFPSLYAYAGVGRVIDKYLNAEEVLEALLEGLKRSASTWNVQSCLLALRLYRKPILRDPASTRTNTLLQGIRKLVSELEHSEDAAMRKVATNASKSLAILENHTTT